jgi:protein phosphatase
MNGAITLLVGHASHTGLVREVNEDSYLVLAPPAVSSPVDALILVADGVGGTNAGEVASGVLVESFYNWFRGTGYVAQVHYNPSHPDYFIAALKDLLESVNERLYQMAASRTEWASMGTTATVALLSAGRLYLGHVGDTRAYLLRGSALRQLTADHSWVADEVAAGRLTEAQAQDHPRRNVINRVLGNGPLLRVDRQAYDVEPGDIFILTTDGLTGLVNDGEIRGIVTGSRAPQEACNQLVALANQRGGHDNVTVVIAQLAAGEGKPIGLGAGGEALQSVYLGRGPVAAPNGRGRPSARPRSRPAATAVANRPPRDSGRLGIALLLLIALALVGGILAYAAFSGVQNEVSLNVAGQSIAPELLAGICTVLSLLFGFLMGYIGRKWVVERHH